MTTLQFLLFETVNKSTPLSLAECQTFIVGENGLLVEQMPSSEIRFVDESLQDSNLILGQPSFSNDVILLEPNPTTSSNVDPVVNNTIETPNKPEHTQFHEPEYLEGKPPNETENIQLHETDLQEEENPDEPENIQQLQEPDFLEVVSPDEPDIYK